MNYRYIYTYIHIYAFLNTRFRHQIYPLILSMIKKDQSLSAFSTSTPIFWIYPSVLLSWIFMKYSFTFFPSISCPFDESLSWFQQQFFQPPCIIPGTNFSSSLGIWFKSRILALKPLILYLSCSSPRTVGRLDTAKVFLLFPIFPTNCSRKSLISSNTSFLGYLSIICLHF